MNQQSGPQDPLVLSYLALRKAVGIIGCSLPIALGLGGFFAFHARLQTTMSDYYYTGMRNIFVASLCAIGIFLMSTRGYDRKDEIAGRLASAFAIGVALFPTTPDICPTHEAKIIGGIHLSSAALFYLTLAYFSIKLFTQTTPENRPTRQKMRRNIVYRVCGYAILACLASILVVKLAPANPRVARIEPVFWLESFASVSFGVSWLVKGETILKDQES
jgi:hypothetical protein